MNYTKITSQSNPKIKTVIDIRRRKSRTENVSFIIEGPHLVEMALDADASIDEVFFSEAFGSKKEGQKLLKQLSLHTTRIFEVTDGVFHKLAETETPQGIIAVVTCRQLSLNQLRLKGNALLVVSDGIQDPGNLGTIIRTADASGADAVIILPGTCDVFMQKTIRSTAGSVFNIPIAHASVDELVDWLRSQKINLVVTAADAEQSLFEVRLEKPVALVFGNEAHGAQEDLKKAADITLRIPIYGKAESLNVASAAAACLYEAARQRSR
ncbi:MAG: RNA methyltransferase [Nitrospiraceae bacterium]|jgi:RNA methyltransferase, TrmH family|nr:MAG: RNA methyltransferase [Nitrospiraceae bacterium]